MKVQLVTQTQTHGEAVRALGKYKPIISFRKDKPSFSQGGTSAGESYIMTSAHSFSSGQVVKYGDNYFKVTNVLNSMAYIYQYRLQVEN